MERPAGRQQGSHATRQLPSEKTRSVGRQVGKQRKSHLDPILGTPVESAEPQRSKLFGKQMVPLVTSM